MRKKGVYKTEKEVYNAMPIQTKPYEMILTTKKYCNLGCFFGVLIEYVHRVAWMKVFKTIP